MMEIKMPINEYRDNHYVPQWYQKRFLPEIGEKKLFHLDLSPTLYSREGYPASKGGDIKMWGTASCFKQKDLYTTFFGDLYSTEIERYFFGEIDRKSKIALEYLAEFQHPNWQPDLMTNFFEYISIQKLRTPKGLALLREQLNVDNNGLLFALQRLQQMFCATWSECIWAIASAESSETKFILTDHPVTVYNRKYPVGSILCKTHFDPDIRINGTHTIFPLSKNKILIGTNLSWVRNPFSNEKSFRPNSRLFRQTLFNMQGIQINRNLNDLEVNEINFVLKSRAFRYIAAEKKSWLYPETRINGHHWSRLGNGYLFMPDPRSVDFTLDSTLGYSNGYSEVFDAYGRPSPIKQSEQDAAFKLFQASQCVFAERVGQKRRGCAYLLGKLEPEADSLEMHNHYLSFNKYVPSHYRE